MFKRLPQHTIEPGVTYFFTDGSCYPNPGPGGWGFVRIRSGRVLKRHGPSLATTNNAMELTAALEALKLAQVEAAPVLIVSDSQYTINCITKWSHGWQRTDWHRNDSPIPNREIIKEAFLLMKPNIKFAWVRGHQGNVFKYNEIADELAGSGRQEALAILANVCKPA